MITHHVLIEEGRSTSLYDGVSTRPERYFSIGEFTSIPLVTSDPPYRSHMGHLGSFSTPCDLYQSQLYRLSGGDNLRVHSLSREYFIFIVHSHYSWLRSSDRSLIRDNT